MFIDSDLVVYVTNFVKKRGVTRQDLRHIVERATYGSRRISTRILLWICEHILLGPIKIPTPTEWMRNCPGWTFTFPGCETIAFVPDAPRKSPKTAIVAAAASCFVEK